MSAGGRGRFCELGDDLMGVYFALAPASFPVCGEPDCRVSRRSYFVKGRQGSVK